MWFVEGKCYEEILGPLGLYSTGGGSRNNVMTYNIRSKKYGLICELTAKEIENILDQEEIKVYLRKDKIKNVINKASS